MLKVRAMVERILVINPNSNREVTAAIDRNLESLRFADGPEICCWTLEDTPLGIETARHIDQVVEPLCDLIAREDNHTSAFVIACFGDPGLASAREATSKPVIGIGEAGIAVALNRGERYGILTNLPEDINPGLRQIRALGLGARLAGIEAAGIAVVDLGDETRARAGLLSAAWRLKEKGAEAVVLGCAGMVPYGPDLETQTGLKVIDPVHAAAGVAIVFVRAAA
jgi:Asp/Glu/hydantoin racemase